MRKKETIRYARDIVNYWILQGSKYWKIENGKIMPLPKEVTLTVAEQVSVSAGSLSSREKLIPLLVTSLMAGAVYDVPKEIQPPSSKADVVAQVAAKRGMKVKVIALNPVLDDPTDVRGLPCSGGDTKQIFLLLSGREFNVYTQLRLRQNDGWTPLPETFRTNTLTDKDGPSYVWVSMLMTMEAKSDEKEQ